VAHVDNESPWLRSFWHPVALSAEVTSVPQRVLLLGQPYAMVRLDGAAAAFPDRCAHRGTRLSAGTVVAGERGEVLQCAYHGWCYDRTGTCVLAPSVGAAPSAGSRAAVDTPAVCEEHGVVWLAPEPPREPVLPFPEWTADGFVGAALRVRQAHVGAAQLMENNFDFSHLPYVHAASFGYSYGQPEPDSIRIERGTAAVDIRFDAPVTDHPGSLAPHHSVCSAPFTAWLRVDLPDGRVQVWYQAIQPERNGSSRVYQLTATNEAAEDALERQVGFTDIVLDEDLAVLELIDDPALDLAPEAGAHVPADRASLAYRRLLRELAPA
jgi:phenylpropionate dioxygenase-like ring-hydroxylating dioxygenase large terminal subunit